ncbi:MAG: formyltransferase family protein [Eubacterium ramulus]
MERGYYGLRVHEGVLARGVKVTGATVHFVDTGTDTGPIILAESGGSTAGRYSGSASNDVSWKKQNGRLLPKAIDLIANGRVSVEDE